MNANYFQDYNLLRIVLERAKIENFQNDASGKNRIEGKVDVRGKSVLVYVTRSDAIQPNLGIQINYKGSDSSLTASISQASTIEIL